MATPGIGSVVIYHDTVGSAVAPFPAIVICMHDTWATITNGGTSYFPTQPTADQVILSVIGYTSGATEVMAAEGTSAGEFSRISLALDLGTIDLGSVDLSNTTATNVNVPDV